MSVPAPKPSQERAGPYVLVTRIGQGGNATTYKAIRPDSGVNAFCCVKQIHQHLVYDSEALRAFRKEARVASSLTHQNLAGLLDCDTTHNPPYLVYQFIDGIDLQALIRSQSLGVEDVLFIGSEIAAGLNAAHNYRAEHVKGIIHRDLSPANVMISKQGDVVITDFGLAKIQSAVSGTVTTHDKGTRPYMPAEALQGKALRPSGDMYSLGVILYELASKGRRPFEGPSDAAVGTAIIKGEYADIAKTARQYPPRFHKLVRNLLQLDPEARPTAREVMAAFHDCGASRARRQAVGALVELTKKKVSTRPPVEPPAAFTETQDQVTDLPERRFRKPALFTLLAALLVLVGLGAGATWWGLRDNPGPSASEPAPPTVTVVEAPPTTAPPAEDKIREVVSSEPPPKAAPVERTPEPVAKKAKPSPRPVVKKPKALPKRGKVRVRAKPWGDLYVNGKPAGRAPKTLTLKAGTHRIEARAGGFNATRKVKVEAGKTIPLTIEIKK